jgi:hypothetical protein
MSKIKIINQTVVYVNLGSEKSVNQVSQLYRSGQAVKN